MESYSSGEFVMHTWFLRPTVFMSRINLGMSNFLQCLQYGMIADWNFARAALFRGFSLGELGRLLLITSATKRPLYRYSGFYPDTHITFECLGTLEDLTRRASNSLSSFRNSCCESGFCICKHEFASTWYYSTMIRILTQSNLLWNLLILYNVCIVCK